MYVCVCVCVLVCVSERDSDRERGSDFGMCHSRERRHSQLHELSLFRSVNILLSVSLACIQTLFPPAPFHLSLSCFLSLSLSLSLSLTPLTLFLSLSFSFSDSLYVSPSLALFPSLTRSKKGLTVLV